MLNTRHVFVKGSLLLLVSSFCSADCPADLLTTLSGKEYAGELSLEGNRYFLRRPDGTKRSFDKSIVAKIVPAKQLREQFQKFVAQADIDNDRHIDVLGENATKWALQGEFRKVIEEAARRRWTKAKDDPAALIKLSDWCVNYGFTMAQVIPLTQLQEKYREYVEQAKLSDDRHIEILSDYASKWTLSEQFGKVLQDAVTERWAEAKDHPENLYELSEWCARYGLQEKQNSSIARVRELTAPGAPFESWMKAKTAEVARDLSSSDAAVRRTAIAYVCSHGMDRALWPLLAAIRKEDAEAKKAAIPEWAGVPANRGAPPSRRPGSRTNRRTPPERGRERGDNTARERPPSPFDSALLKMYELGGLESHDKGTRARFAYSLFMVTDLATLDCLIAMMKDPDEEVRTVAALAMAGISVKGGMTCLMDEDVASKIVACLKHEKDPKVRVALAVTLGLYSQTAPAANALISLLSDEDHTVRRIAAKGMGYYAAGSKFQGRSTDRGAVAFSMKCGLREVYSPVTRKGRAEIQYSCQCIRLPVLPTTDRLADVVVTLSSEDDSAAPPSIPTIGSMNSPAVAVTYQLYFQKRDCVRPNEAGMRAALEKASKDADDRVAEQAQLSLRMFHIANP